MSLCRFLPTPSDRMGILWSLLTIDDSVILEYGPAGTTHYSVGFFGKMNLGKENRLFTTHMNEDDVIMGNIERLEEAIREVNETFSPKVMFVVASSVSAVIGTDIKGVCNYMQEEVSATLVALDEGGFKGDYSAGVRQITKAVVKSLAEKTEKQSKTFNVLGASMGSYRIESDVNEINRLMTEAFDYSMHTSLFTETSIEDIKTMTKVDINLVISESGLEAAKHLEKKFNIPYLYCCPYGYKGTLAWLEQISEIINVEISENILEIIKEKISETMHYPMFLRMLKGGKPKAYVYGDYDMVKGVSNYLSDMAAEITMECKHSLKNLDDTDITHIPVEKDRIDILKSLNKTILLADDISLDLADNTNTKIRFSLPFLRGAVVANHMPFMGVYGADFIREKYEEYLGSLM